MGYETISKIPGISKKLNHGLESPNSCVVVWSKFLESSSERSYERDLRTQAGRQSRHQEEALGLLDQLCLPKTHFPGQSYITFHKGGIKYSYPITSCQTITNCHGMNLI